MSRPMVVVPGPSETVAPFNGPASATSLGFIRSPKGKCDKWYTRTAKVSRILKGAILKESRRQAIISDSIFRRWNCPGFAYAKADAGPGVGRLMGQPEGNCLADTRRSNVFVRSITGRFADFGPYRLPARAALGGGWWNHHSGGRVSHRWLPNTLPGPLPEFLLLVICVAIFCRQDSTYQDGVVTLKTGGGLCRHQTESSVTCVFLQRKKASTSSGCVAMLQF
jgi:hypothetical protein